MRCDHDDSPWCPTYNPFDGEQGRTLYVSPAGESDGSTIVYRNVRLLSVGPANVVDAFPALGDGPLGFDAHVALAKEDDPLEWTLPAEYEDTTFTINVRPHDDGLELPTMFGWQLVENVAGEPIDGVLGVLVTLTQTKLDGGGVRISFRYIANPAGNQPTSFEIRDEGEELDTTSLSANTSGDYTVSIHGLDDETEYTFAIVAITEDGETELGTLEVVGDSAGPDVAGTLTLTPL